MDIRQTDPGGLRQRLSPVLAARPLLRGLLRALGAKSLESMIFKGNALIYVRTGEAVATYNPETTELIDNRFNLTVATVDMENGVIYPIAAEASEAEVSADAA